MQRGQNRYTILLSTLVQQADNFLTQIMYKDHGMASSYARISCADPSAGWHPAQHRQGVNRWISFHRTIERIQAQKVPWYSKRM